MFRKMSRLMIVAFSFLLLSVSVTYAASAEKPAEKAAENKPSRFMDNGNSTLVDNLTGLIWTKDGNTPGPPSCSTASPKTWRGAQDYVDCLNENNYLGFKDWRLPDLVDLMTLVSIGHENNVPWLNSQGFSNVQDGFYWSLTAERLSMNASAVNLNNGVVFTFKKTANNFYALPVRGGGR